VLLPGAGPQFEILADYPPLQPFQGVNFYRNPPLERGFCFLITAPPFAPYFQFHHWQACRSAFKRTDPYLQSVVVRPRMKRTELGPLVANPALDGIMQCIGHASNRNTMIITKLALQGEGVCAKLLTESLERAVQGWISGKRRFAYVFCKLGISPSPNC
jgi:hypothetical protein